MAKMVLPFEMNLRAGPAALSVERRAKLSHELQTACDSCTFLTGYVQQLPIDEIGVPAYYTKLSRSLGQADEAINLIYPIKEGLYVHIYPDFKGERNHYI